MAGTIAVLLGNGDGTFQTAVSIRTKGAYYPLRRVAVADVNADGKLDLLVANQCDIICATNGSPIAVLLGNGDGTFQAAVSYGSGGYEPSSIAVADVNGDGKPDLLVANRCGSSGSCIIGFVGVLLGNGDGTFQPAVTYSSGGSFADSIAVADVNGDGKLDLLVANNCVSSCDTTGSAIGVLLGNGNGTFQAAVLSLTAPFSFNPGGQIAVADFDGDGKLDLVTGSILVLGNGDGTFQAPLYLGAGPRENTGAAVGDFDGDGRPDVALGGVTVLLNITSPASQTITVTTPAPPTATLKSSFTVAASASSKLPVTFTSAGGCTNSGTTYTMANTGKVACSVIMNQAGNGHYSAAPQITETVAVAKAVVPTVTFTGAPAAATYLSTFTVATNSGSDFSVPTITASGCTISGTTVTMTRGTGTCTLTAKWAANYIYAAATLKQATTNELGASVTTITSNTPNPSTVRKKVTIDYTVAQANGNPTHPTGTVTVNASTGESCHAGLSAGSGHCSITFTTSGARTLTATYAGNTNNSTSASPPVTQTVN